ncbi:hypothetical protein [Blastomonas fulva]|uniref:hypothetical protein n=1 Tax=Blastomonas fulva TaxID=1550728 RepID=UPI003F7136F6
MKLSDDMRFAHPVLTPETGDFSEGIFSLETEVEEILATGKVSIRYNIELTETSVRELVENGLASVGIFVRCGDTFYSDLRELGWPEGKVEFEKGSLLNRVTIRPVIWLSQPLPEWKPDNVHPEFTLPLQLAAGDILAFDDEQVLSVGQAKLAPMESIFALVASPSQPEGQLSVKLDDEKITIIAGEQTFKMINALRHSLAKAAVLSSVYLPAVMEVLDALRDNPEAHENRRWKQPFAAKCTVANIDYQSSLLENAQTLLEMPLRRLDTIAEARS